MNFPLIGIHAWFGEVAALMFIWAFIEMFSGQASNIRRARFAVLCGVLFLVAAWIAGGFYYVGIYGSEVKPFIKEGPLPWAHGVAMETKEHVFIFLPFLGALAWSVMQRFGHMMEADPRARAAGLYATGAAAILAGFMALTGFLVSSGFRSALEQLVA
ncbi:MAG: hypothetical protein V2I48_04230 [Xanthomonadales bacterium]|jgi:hypothetical protein|nr:hypothetical protein [Xanthomonadales bacterium]